MEEPKKISTFIKFDPKQTKTKKTKTNPQPQITQMHLQRQIVYDQEVKFIIFKKK